MDGFPYSVLADSSSLWHAWLFHLGWMALVGLLIPYLLYPVGVSILASLASNRTRLKVHGDKEPSPTTSDSLPSVTIVIAAYNASEWIEGRLENLLQCDYPAQRREIVVVSDGSTDDTVEKASNYLQAGVRILSLPHRSGKTLALEYAVSQVHTDVMVLSDVSAVYQRDTLLQLAKHFGRPEVGIVSGELHIVDQHGKQAEGAYWRIEAAVRRAEGILGICTGVSGAVYAMRRHLFVATQRPTINDDMVLPLLACCRARERGEDCRFVQEPQAIAAIAAVDDPGTQYRRRSRISHGVWQALPILIPLTWKLGLDHFLAFFLHKILRWFGPCFLLVLAIASIVCFQHEFFQWLGYAQLACYTLALVGGFIPHRCFTPFTSFVRMNLGIASGFFMWLRQPNLVLWEPSRRQRVMDATQEPKHAL